MLNTNIYTLLQTLNPAIGSIKHYKLDCVLCIVMSVEDLPLKYPINLGILEPMNTDRITYCYF